MNLEVIKLKLMSILVLMLLAVSTLFGASTKSSNYNKYYKELENLSSEQIAILFDSYYHGKEHDLELTLAAIAWKESSFGKFKVNSKDGKYGSFSSYQIKLDTHAKANNIEEFAHIIEEASKLLHDNDYAAQVAIKNLLYWKERRSTYSGMLASYNAGNKGLKNPKGRAYANDVKLRVKVLSDFIKDGYPFKNLDVLISSN